MKSTKIDKYLSVCASIKDIIQKTKEIEKSYELELAKVHPVFKKSAVNLLHYLAFRTFNIDELQIELKNLGLPSLSSIEGHVMRSLYNLQNILHHLLGLQEVLNPKGYVSVKKSERIMRKNNKLLFGYKSNKRTTRIMVTLPSIAADEPIFVENLISLGMNCARINCAHDNPDSWTGMIKNIHKANEKLKKNCKITMDLAGPKIRTGAVDTSKDGIKIKALCDDLGKINKSALLWIAPPDVLPPFHEEFNPIHIIPVPKSLYKFIKRNDTLLFKDSHGKTGSIIINRKEGKGKWGLCEETACLETGTEFILEKFKKTNLEDDQKEKLVPKDQFIKLFEGDKLILHKDSRSGKNASYDENGIVAFPAHISCTFPQIFNDVKIGEPIFFNDGKIEGVIKSVTIKDLEVCIVNAKKNGSKLRADKGINLPESNLSISGLTEKDKIDLSFIAKHADAVNLSFVNTPQDVLSLQKLLNDNNSDAGIILKIESQKGFTNLPAILLTAMQGYPLGVMIARGDLAVETGWKNFAIIQQEILRICRAAHIPQVWGTQVLENLIKKGTPSRSEITDVSMAGQADCVMLNKGSYIEKGVKMLNKILRQMQSFQNKTGVVLPKLTRSNKLILSHKSFDSKK